MAIRTVVWEPRLGPIGQPFGILLDAEFAIACSHITLTKEMLQNLEHYVWSMVKPADWKKNYIPSHIFQFVDESLLLRAIYHRHSAASGQDLGMDQLSWSGQNTTEPVRYSYHQQGRSEDFWANIWLQFAFSWWVRFARIQIKRV